MQQIDFSVQSAIRRVCVSCTCEDLPVGISKNRADRAVAFVMDDILLASLVAGSKTPDDYVISKDAFSKPEPYGIMLRKDDVAFKKVVDAATAALYTGGEGQKIYEKWFTQKIPPKNLNLNVPISSELKNEFAKPSDSPDPDSYK